MIDVLKAILSVLVVLTLIVIGIVIYGFGLPHGMAIYFAAGIILIYIIGMVQKDGDK
jgi:hypothetical protein